MMTDVVTLTNEQIRQRDGDRCSRDVREHGGPLDVHHRLPRSGVGGELASNRVTLCRRCHDWAHKNPAAAREAGWVVSRSADPARIPVDHVLYPLGPILLLEDGGIQIWQEEDLPMDYAGGPAGLTRSNVGTCPVCGWTGPGRDAPFHECIDYRSMLAGGVTSAEPVRSQCCPMDTYPLGCECQDECTCMCPDCQCESWGDEDDA